MSLPKTDQVRTDTCAAGKASTDRGLSQRIFPRRPPYDGLTTDCRYSNQFVQSCKSFLPVIRGLDLVHGLLFEDFTARFPGCLWGWAIAEAIVEKVPFFYPPQNQLICLEWTHLTYYTPGDTKGQ